MYSSSFSSGYSSPNYAPSAPPVPPPTSQSYFYSSQPYPVGQFGNFQPGTHPEIVRSFQAVVRDRCGSIDEWELQAALSSGYQKFSLRTIRLLMFLFGNQKNPSKIGPTEFAALWNSLGQWMAIFERFDRDRSGEIDSAELKDALLSLGYAVPPSVVQVLISKYNDGRGGRGSLNFDSFVEYRVGAKVFDESGEVKVVICDREAEKVLYQPVEYMQLLYSPWNGKRILEEHLESCTGYAYIMNINLSRKNYVLSRSVGYRVTSIERIVQAVVPPTIIDIDIEEGEDWNTGTDTDDE